MILWAAEYGKVDMVKYYLAHPEFDPSTIKDNQLIKSALGCQVKTKGLTAEWLYWYSSKAPSHEMLDLLIDDGRFDFNKMLEYGKSPLEIARNTGDVEVVRKVISQLNLTTKPNYWDDVLKTAAYYGQIEIVDELLKLPTTDLSKAFENILGYAYASHHCNTQSEKNRVVILERLLNDDRLDLSSNIESLLYHFIHNGYVDLVDTLLKYEPIAHDIKIVEKMSQKAKETYPRYSNLMVDLINKRKEQLKTHSSVEILNFCELKENLWELVQYRPYIKKDNDE
jgi:ankyrin repeat protein